jgi:putative transposase
VLLLAHGAFHKARPLHLPPNVGLLFFPPSAPELNPSERLWGDRKDWLATSPPTTLDELSTRLMARLTHSSAAAVRSLTCFSYLLAAVQRVNG